jgi:hypothetical protein
MFAFTDEDATHLTDINGKGRASGFDGVHRQCTERPKGGLWLTDLHAQVAQIFDNVIGPGSFDSRGAMPGSRGYASG